MKIEDDPDDLFEQKKWGPKFSASNSIIDLLKLSIIIILEAVVLLH